jgi:hypothetical protein
VRGREQNKNKNEASFNTTMKANPGIDIDKYII